MVIKTIEVSDQLNHHKYQWPLTWIKYPIEFSTEKVDVDSLVLTNEEGQHILYQLSNIHMEEGMLVSAEINFLTNLLSGHSLTYQLHSNKDCKNEIIYSNQVKSITNENEVIINNEHISVHVPQMIGKDERHTVFTLSMHESPILGRAVLVSNSNVVHYMLTPVAEGPVFAEYWLEYVFEDESTYTLSVRIAGGMEYIELLDKSGGITQENRKKLVIEWENFDVSNRYTRHRGDEKIDYYLNKEGQIPYILLPYSSSVSWWETQVAAFSDQKHQVSMGMFTKNTETWNDGEYAIWGSSEALAVKFFVDTDTYLQENMLTCEYPIANGTRGTAIALYSSKKDKESELNCYTNYLWLWYEFLNLNKIKDWVLQWEEDQTRYPKFFGKDCIPEDGISLWWFKLQEFATPEIVEEYLYKLSPSLNNIFQIGPVGTREVYSWVPAFDMAAPKMSQEQFDRLKAKFAFMAYICMDECFMPINHMLAGHPNFLSDVRSITGMMAALFPNHPDAVKWQRSYEKAIARNLKYHVRPTVKDWEAEGGRWTENLGCYTWAALVPILKANAVLHLERGENPILYPNLIKWAKWILYSMSAPVNGKRIFLPQGAHSGGNELPSFYFRMLGEVLLNYDPLLGENLLHTVPYEAKDFEGKGGKTDIWRHLLRKDLKENTGTPPMYRSIKYTGYGVVLRAAVGTPMEMSVCLQQLDEGPNYRWGRAGDGGNGIIYFNASGKRYSFNRSEDVGDANMGDVQNSCNFGVLIGHEYRSVGKNDLKEPMYDFGFAQYAQVNASAYSAPFYQSRSVLVSGHDYIVIYDAVGDMRVCGRFSWFVKEDESFPQIVQVKPGVAGVEVEAGLPVNVAAFTSIEKETAKKAQAKQGTGGGSNAADAKPTTESKGMQFDGFGDFLTVVSALPLNKDYSTRVTKTAYGAKVQLQGRTDFVFRDNARIRYQDQGVTFDGTAGLIRMYSPYKAEAALFKGRKIGFGEIAVEASPDEIKGQGKAEIGFGVKINHGELIGQLMGRTSTKILVRYEKKQTSAKKLYIDSCPCEGFDWNPHCLVFDVPAGKHTWQWTERLPIPENTQIINTVLQKEGAKVYWKKANGATFYHLESSCDGGNTWKKIAETPKENYLYITGFKEGQKIHLRVQPANPDHCGEWSGAYPIYFTSGLPDCPKGFRVWALDSSFMILWGKVLGVGTYRLYRKLKNSVNIEMIYEGEETSYIDYVPVQNDIVYEYKVTAVNDNGESEYSLMRDTSKEGLAYWDPKPEEIFRRCSKSYEYGYKGFNHWENRKNPNYAYPKCDDA